MINYNVNGYGVLEVYNDNTALFEISECENNTEEELKNLIKEVLWERGYEYNGEITRR